ncbi:polypeptide N-acetylgalactosaminyltransferase 2-like [Clytia hemisphaerica]|uniref:Polypeptide N-acetylgalactosaminyltransferase n=1 Tax=Clytia hemisphaerica TaxID=252671 RepID=A0A7M5XIU5_9CNID
MRIHTSRVLIFLLFVIWIGGMLYFFTSSSNAPPPLSPEEQARLIALGKLARDRDHKGHKEHHDIGHGQDHQKPDEKKYNVKGNIFIAKDPKMRSNNRDSRSLKDFDWHGYVQRGALKPGEDKNVRNAYNQEASEKLAWDRPIPDVRDAKCRNKRYDTDLPTTTIIICFHNEGRAALLRTVVSALNRSPDHLLKEIILVDDFSDNPADGKELGSIPKVKVLRNDKREGLIRSRVKGADIAKGDVLTFLDSHCEENEMWLEPLLQAIKDNRKAVVAPIIDVIAHETFEYLSSSSELRGGFGWNLNFKWDFLPPKYLEEHRRDRTAPIKSPAIAGGLFSIDKKWFETLGKYDNQMDVWGGENLEISFRAWQCGGEMHILPCSRVGHVFRERHPYKFPGGSMNVFQKNTRRAAEVWMDDYKRFYFGAVPSARYAIFGDIHERMELRNKLGCKSFKWFLNNVYPELKVPDSDVIKYGSLKNNGENCMDTMGHQINEGVGIFSCHGQGGNQDWSWTKHDQIKHEEICVTAIGSDEHSAVLMRKCDKNDRFQKWRYEEGTRAIVNTGSNLCLDNYKMGQDVVTNKCLGQDTQLWTIDMANS